MAAQPIGVWGIDLGQCGLKAIRLQEIEGQVVATAFDYVEHPKILSQPDADPDQLTREALEKFLSRNNLRGDIVAISVPGQSGLARFVKLPPVEEKKIADIVRFEAKQQIPFNLDEVVWDYQKIGSGVVTDGFAMETEIGLFAMKRDMIGRYLQHFKDVGVDIHLVQMAPLALCNYIAFDLLSKDATGEEGGDKKCVVALDIGADSSNLVITDGERIIWQRPIPLGGNHFTRALTKDLKLTFAKAEHVKRNATKSPDLKKILASLKPVLNDFVGEVQRSLGYFTNTHRDAQIEYMIGLGNAFRLPGLQKFLSEKLQIDVRKLVKMERVSGDQVVSQQAYTENVLTFAVAYGLALQGLKKARLSTNLLPSEIRVDRLVKAKKPFAVAAAAALLLGVGGLALSYALEYRTYNDDRVQKAMKQSKDAVSKAKSARTQFEAAKKKAQVEEEAVRTIVAGQFERDNWPELFKFINTAIPLPDGRKHYYPIPADDGTVAGTIEMSNLSDKAQREYWGPKAQNALKEYLSQRLGGDGKPDGGGGKEPSSGIEDLVQFNIESVQGFFCDNLDAYWDQVKKSPKLKSDGKSLVRPEEDFQKKPEGSGWIIEIHGWTYHRDKEIFIKETLLENLARLGVRAKKADGAPVGGAPAPVAAAPTGVPPRGPNTLPGQPVAEDADKKESSAEDHDPVINHISHIVLFDYKYSSKDSPFEILTPSTHANVRALAEAQPVVESANSGGGMSGMPGGGMAPPGGMSPPGGGMAGMAGGMGGMAGGMGGTTGGDKAVPSTRSRSGWTGLGEEGVAAGGAGQFGGRGKGPNSGMPAGMGPMSMKPPTGTGGPMQPPGGMRRPDVPGGTAPPKTEEAGNDKGLQRTEFVILFVWKEPTDSDNLRGLTEGGTSGAAGGKPAIGSGNASSAPPKRFRRQRGGRNRQKGG